MLEANELWNSGRVESGDGKFLRACAIMHKHYNQKKDPWYARKSPVSELVQWSIRRRYVKRVKELHEETQFAEDGYHY